MNNIAEEIAEELDDDGFLCPFSATTPKTDKELEPVKAVINHILAAEIPEVAKGLVDTSKRYKLPRTGIMESVMGMFHVYIESTDEEEPTARSDLLAIIAAALLTEFGIEEK